MLFQVERKFPNFSQGEIRMQHPFSYYSVISRWIIATCASCGGESTRVDRAFTSPPSPIFPLSHLLFLPRVPFPDIKLETCNSNREFCQWPLECRSVTIERRRGAILKVILLGENVPGWSTPTAPVCRAPDSHRVWSRYGPCFWLWQRRLDKYQRNLLWRGELSWTIVT